MLSRPSMPVRHRSKAPANAPEIPPGVAFNSVF
jgi:hypothetical protein